MDERPVLQILMQWDYVTVDWIAKMLSATRSEVLAAVRGLRKQGYAIYTHPKLGYHLNPPEDAVWPVYIRRGLRTRWVGSTIEYHETIGSTNARAKALGAAGGKHGALVIANHQTEGRGRMARSWVAQPGTAILMSLLVKPERLDTASAPLLVFVAALAGADACAAMGGDVRIKWPNDLVARGRKLSGMLAEIGADGEGNPFAVIGVGINVTTHPVAEGIQAISLDSILGRPTRRSDMVAQFLNAFERRYEMWASGGAAAILSDYRRLSATIGAQVRAECADGTALEGVAEDVCEDGALLVRLPDGETRALRAGDVSVRGIMGYV